MKAPKNIGAAVLAAMCSGLVAISCSGAGGGGIFPGTMETPRQVSLAELASYYDAHSGGLITPTRTDTAIRFEWDPYFKKRIYPATVVQIHQLQELFAFDAEGFVEKSGQRDFVSASNQFYRNQSYDPRKQTYTRPYRYLSAWGSLFHPPIKQLTQPLSFYHAEFTEGFDSKSVESTFFDPAFQQQLDRETQTELTYGNELHALFNGVESYPEKLRLTSEATKFLYVAVMTIVADSSGRDLVRNMVNAKRAGVDVRLITEGFYTLSISNYCVGVLEREGIPVVRVNDKTLSQLNRMFHNKIWIKDGEEAILGGMNILNYENYGDGFNFLNRDTDILIRGPAVTNLLERFIALWKQYDTGNRSIALGEYTLATRLAAERAAGVRGKEHYARWLGNPETRMNGICRVAVQGNKAEPQKIVMLLLRYLEAARQSCYIKSPEIDFELERKIEYVDMLAGLIKEKAADLEFYMAYITNGFDGGVGESSAFIRSRVHDAKLTGESFWEDMLTPLVDEEGRSVNQRVRRVIRPLVSAGVHGFQYFNYVHAKEFYFDRLLVGIGSWNFDIYSSDNNHESAIFCLDERLRKQMEQQTVIDLVNSVPIIPASELR